MRPDEALAAYNAVMSVTGAPYPLRASPKNLALAAEVVALCDARGWDVTRYFRARLDAVGGLHRVPLPQLVRVSGVFEDAFQRWGDHLQAQPEATARLMAACVDETPREGPDLVPHAELAKAAFARTGDAVLCRALSLDLTLGYNGRSEHCRACCEAGACRSALPERVRRAREGT